MTAATLACSNQGEPSQVRADSVPPSSTPPACAPDLVEVEGEPALSLDAVARAADAVVVFRIDRRYEVDDTPPAWPDGEWRVKRMAEVSVLRSTDPEIAREGRSVQVLVANAEGAPGAPGEVVLGQEEDAELQPGVSGVGSLTKGGPDLELATGLLLEGPDGVRRDSSPRCEGDERNLIPQQVEGHTLDSLFEKLAKLRANRPADCEMVEVTDPVLSLEDMARQADVIVAFRVTRRYEQKDAAPGEHGIWRRKRIAEIEVDRTTDPKVTPEGGRVNVYVADVSGGPQTPALVMGDRAADGGLSPGAVGILGLSGRRPEFEMGAGLILQGPDGLRTLGDDECFPHDGPDRLPAQIEGLTIDSVFDHLTELRAERRGT